MKVAASCVGVLLVAADVMWPLIGLLVWPFLFRRAARLPRSDPLVSLRLGTTQTLSSSNSSLSLAATSNHEPPIYAPQCQSLQDAFWLGKEKDSSGRDC
jgi:hypothetical protein